MPNIIGCLGAILVLLIPQSSLASNGQETRTITVMAARSCLQWTKDADEARGVGQALNGMSATINHTWALGVLTGMNGAFDIDYDALESIDSQVVKDWLDDYCNKNPKQSVYTGVNELFKALRKIAQEQKKKVKPSGKRR